LRRYALHSRLGSDESIWRSHQWVLIISSLNSIKTSWRQYNKRGWFEVFEVVSVLNGNAWMGQLNGYERLFIAEFWSICCDTFQSHPLSEGCLSTTSGQVSQTKRLVFFKPFSPTGTNSNKNCDFPFRYISDSVDVWKLGKSHYARLSVNWPSGKTINI
jgi:hypothetical protein